MAQQTISSMERGFFIVLEGIDNCGKTTQSRLLKEYLESRGLAVCQTREPGGTRAGEQIRRVLLRKRRKLLEPITQTLLFYAARAEFINQIVCPNLDKGVTVITDRFEASTYVYQGRVQGVRREVIDFLSLQVVGKSGYKPDLYIVLDILAKESFKRGANDDNKGQDLVYEKQGIEFMQKLRRGYLDFAKKFEGSKVVLIDGMQNRETISEKINKIVEQLLII